MIQLPKRIADIRSLSLNWMWLATVVPLIAIPSYANIELDDAILIAQQIDPWIQGSQYQQQAIEADSIAAGTLPDPVVNAGFLNVPTNSFEFNEEPMTQFKAGITQILPRGDSLALRQKQLSVMSSQYPYQRDDRRAKVAVNVAELWLESFRANQSIQLIEDDRDLFEHLVDVARSSYASTLGKTRQQDLVRAQLELTRLDDRLTILRERKETEEAKLLEWIGPVAAKFVPGRLSGYSTSLDLSKTLPIISLQHPELVEVAQPLQPQLIATRLADHPAILNIDAKIDATDTGVALAEQSYKPEWRINAGYGYRDNSPSGQNRSDFLSVEIAIDLPFFTAKKQDKQVQSAIATTEAVRTEKALLLRSMIAAFDTQRARLHRLDERRELYQNRLLEEMATQAEASLTAYTNDDGDFAEVVRARIAELNAKIDALDIEVDRLKAISRLNYFFTNSSV
tara:strand:- start:15668 stop:17029 length:1362 start_codon:yes stop_codon:yes gene_type:complete